MADTKSNYCSLILLFSSVCSLDPRRIVKSAVDPPIRSIYIYARGAASGIGIAEYLRGKNNKTKQNSNPSMLLRSSSVQ